MGKHHHLCGCLVPSWHLLPALGIFWGNDCATFGWRAIFSMLGVLAVWPFFMRCLDGMKLVPKYVEAKSRYFFHPGSRSFWVYTIGFGAAMGLVRLVSVPGY